MNLQSTSNVTYEHETQIYDPDYADFGNYWSSNMYDAYLDTSFGDSSSLDNFTIGTSDANRLVAGKQYYTYMSLTAGSSNDEAYVIIKGQKGYRAPAFCHSTWCIFALATSGHLTKGYTPLYGTNEWHYPPLLARD